MTFLEAQNAIADWLAVDDKKLPTSARRHLINLALVEIQREDRWRYCLTTQQFTLQGNQWVMPTPQRFLDTKKIVVDQHGPLEFLPSSEFRERTKIYTTAPLGTPSYYTIEGEEILFSARPADALSGAHTYYRLLPPLVADSDTNPFLTNHFDLVLFAALANAALFSIEDPRIPLFQSKKNEALQRVLVGEGRVGVEALRRPQSRIPGV